MNISDFRLIGDRFICNIAQPENSPGGLFLVNRDPRKQRIPPDAYVGIVEKVGPKCRLLYPGQRVVLRRWVYRQHDLDHERILAYQHQVLILDDEIPYPGVIVLRILQDVIKTSLVVPDTIKDKKKKPPAYAGVIIASGVSAYKKDDMVWVERRDRGQFFLNPTTLIFKDEPDNLSGEGPILMKAEKIPMLQVI